MDLPSLFALALNWHILGPELAHRCAVRHGSGASYKQTQNKLLPCAFLTEVFAMPDYPHAHPPLTLTAAHLQTSNGIANERKFPTFNAVGLAFQPTGSSDLSDDHGDSTDLKTNEPPTNSNPNFQLTTMAAYLTNLKNGTQPVSNANQEKVGARSRHSLASSCPSKPNAIALETELAPHSRHKKQQPPSQLNPTGHVCSDTLQIQLAPLRSLANEVARNAVLASCRRRRVLRKLACFATGLLAIYTAYYLYGTLEPTAWPISWPLVWSR